jgi:site-specific DNA recombinase
VSQPTQNDTMQDLPVKQAVLLLRVSSKRQTDTASDIDPDGNSISSQRRSCQQKAKQMGVVVADEYIEPGFSGQSIDKRPIFRKMLARIVEQGDIDYVIIDMRSRAFRNHFEATMVKHQLAKLGVKLVSAKEDFGNGLMADAMEAMTDVFNEIQVRLNGQDIKNKMGNKARDGGTIGRAKLGYLNIRVTAEGPNGERREFRSIGLDPQRHELVKMAFKLFATGRYTIDSLHDELEELGLRTRATARWPAGPVSKSRLGQMLRDRYYIGKLEYDGIEYNGMHEALVSEDLFDRVQRVLDEHSGSGARQRSHPHYLKGVVWCGRCRRRFIVQRSKGRHGGVYLYFFCRGRQEGICDQPYMPVEVVEEAVIRHYANLAAYLPADFLAEVQAGVDASLTDTLVMTETVRAQLTARLDGLDQKESYFLDLAAEAGWPKDKLRTKIDGLRAERTSIRRELDRTQRQDETGREVFHRALELARDPQAMYRRGGETVRRILNAAFFTRLYVDVDEIVGQELREPFDVLRSVHDGYHRRPAQRTYRRSSAALQHKIAAPTSGNGDQGFSLTDWLAQTPGGHVSSKAVMVGHEGFEPDPVVEAEIGGPGDEGGQLAAAADDGEVVLAGGECHGFDRGGRGLVRVQAPGVQQPQSAACAGLGGGMLRQRQAPGHGNQSVGEPPVGQRVHPLSHRRVRYRYGRTGGHDLGQRLAGLVVFGGGDHVGAVRDGDQRDTAGRAGEGEGQPETQVLGVDEVGAPVAYQARDLVGQFFGVPGEVRAVRLLRGEEIGGLLEGMLPHARAGERQERGVEVGGEAGVDVAAPDGGAAGRLQGKVDAGQDARAGHRGPPEAAVGR